jgi:hypothetical protein
VKSGGAVDRLTELPDSLKPIVQRHCRPFGYVAIVDRLSAFRRAPTKTDHTLLPRARATTGRVASLTRAYT